MSAATPGTASLRERQWRPRNSGLPCSRGANKKSNNNIFHILSNFPESVFSDKKKPSYIAVYCLIYFKFYVYSEQSIFVCIDVYGVSISLAASANNDGNKYDDVISACVNSSDAKKVFFLHFFFYLHCEIFRYQHQMFNLQFVLGICV